MPKFNAKRGIQGVKRKAKKLPGKVVKQLPNAAMVAGPVGIARGVAARVVKRKAKKKSSDTGSAFWNRLKRYESEARRESDKRTGRRRK